jgi:acyl carrier protein
MSPELQQVADAVCGVGKLSGLGPDQDIYDAGFSSVSALELLIELETVFGVSIPDDAFITARTVRDMFGLIQRLQGQPA